MTPHLIPSFGKQTGHGYKKITEAGDTSAGGLDTQMDFGIKMHRRGESIDEASSKESVWVLLRGAAKVEVDGSTHEFQRESIFDDPPTAIHLGPGARIVIEPLSDEVEWAITRTDNSMDLESVVYTPDELAPEYRGAGLV